MGQGLSACVKQAPQDSRATDAEVSRRNAAAATSAPPAASAVATAPAADAAPAASGATAPREEPAAARMIDDSAITPTSQRSEGTAAAMESGDTDRLSMSSQNSLTFDGMDDGAQSMNMDGATRSGPLSTGSLSTGTGMEKSLNEHSSIAESEWYGADTAADRVMVAEEHIPAPQPKNETSRLETLQCFGVLDTAPERKFNLITELLSELYDVPIALVSLVDAERQWFKSVVGLDVTETPRSMSFCAWTLLPLNPELLIVSDAANDPRFHLNPLVTDAPNITFYAGCPIVTSNGDRLGSLCVIDNRGPRSISMEQGNMLANFAELVVRDLERDLMLTPVRTAVPDLLQKTNGKSMRASTAFRASTMFVDTSAEKWKICYVNEDWTSLVGRNIKDASFWDIFTLGADKEQPWREFEGNCAANEEFSILVSATGSDGRKNWFRCNFRTAAYHTVDYFMPSIVVPCDLHSEPLARNYYFVNVEDKVTADKRNSVTNMQRGLTPAALADMRDQALFNNILLGPLLGLGSSAKVCRGLQAGTHVAVKVMCHNVRPEVDVGAALEQKALDHPNLLTRYLACTRPADPMSTQMMGGGPKGSHETWLVVRYCCEGNLANAVQSGWFSGDEAAGDDGEVEVDWSMVLLTAMQMVDALSYLHSNGYVHGNLSMNNVLLGQHHEDPSILAVYIADAGHSSLLDTIEGRRPEDIDMLTEGRAAVSHLPPERLVGSQPAREAGDIWALGVNIFLMACHQLPFVGATKGDIAARITSGQPPDFPEHVPDELISLLEECLAIDPADRPSASSVLESLQRMSTLLQHGDFY